MTGIRRRLAFGTGIGIEVGATDLRVTVVRVRPSGVRILAASTITGFRERPAGEWGAECLRFLRKAGAGHLAAAVLLPRQDVVVRQVALPGVSRRDVAAAIAYQIDSLHPYPEDEIVYDATRIAQSPSILVGVTRSAVLERYALLFAEAGIKVASFTFSAAVLYSAMRVLAQPPEAGFLAVAETEGGLEAYGESDARPLFSAVFDFPAQRAAALAAAELRLEDVEPRALAELLPAPAKAPEDFDFSRATLSYATALAGACPWPALRANLLPPEKRESNSRAMYVPTAALAALTVMALGALAMQGAYEDRRYLAALQAEIAGLEPKAGKAAQLETEIVKARSRAAQLDDMRRRTHSDLEALRGLTELLEAPTWVSGLDLTRESATITGEAEQAAGLLKLLDESPLFRNSEFTMAIARTGSKETFRIRTVREAGR